MLVTERFKLCLKGQAPGCPASNDDLWPRMSRQAMPPLKLVGEDFDWALHGFIKCPAHYQWGQMNRGTTVAAQDDTIAGCSFLLWNVVIGVQCPLLGMKVIYQLLLVSLG